MVIKVDQITLYDLSMETLDEIDYFLTTSNITLIGQSHIDVSDVSPARDSHHTYTFENEKDMFYFKLRFGGEVK